MDIKQALHIVKKHQLWRRGAEIPMQDVRQLGIAIDILIEAVEKILKEKK